MFKDTLDQLEKFFYFYFTKNFIMKGVKFCQIVFLLYLQIQF